MNNSNYFLKDGFTLLELVIVVIIVAVLAGLGLPLFQGAIIKARLTESYNVVSAIAKAEEIYYAQYGAYICAEAPCNPIDPAIGVWIAGAADKQALEDDLGVKLPGGGALPQADFPASLTSGTQRHFLVYGNYDVLLSYNCAHAYALSVALLSDRLGP